MATTPLVPMYAPDGTLGDIPWDQMSAALKAGGHMGVHMKAPDGTEGVIPAERLQDAVKQGGQVIPYDIHEIPKAKKGTWETFADDIKSVFSGLPHMLTTPPGEAGREAGLVVGAHTVKEKREGYSLPYIAGSVVAQGAGANVPGMEEAAKQGNSDAVIGHMLAGQALQVPALLHASGAGDVLSKVSSKVTGGLAEYKPQIVEELGKTHSLTGRAVKVAAEKMLPDKPVYPGAALPSSEEFYATEGAEQEAIRKRTAMADRATARETAAQQRATAKTQGTLSQMANARFPGAASSMAPNFEGPLPEPGSVPQPKLVEPPKPQGKIASATEGAPKTEVSEGRPATWTNERVIQLATQGNRDAIAQAVRRGFMLPENVRYVMGDMDYPSAVHNPRSVTKFTPTGEPITQGESDFAYRSRDVGEKGVPADQRSHAHATTDLGDLQQLAPGRASITGKGQEFVRTDLSKLTEGKDYVRMQRAGQPDWIRFLRPLDENEIEVVGNHPAPKPHRFSNSSRTRQQILDLAKEPPEEKQ